MDNKKIIIDSILKDGYETVEALKKEGLSELEALRKVYIKTVESNGSLNGSFFIFLLRLLHAFQHML